MPQFIPGLDLNRRYFQQVIMPLMNEHFPKLKYAAGLVGEGSDVLGFDNPQSMDHNWGPHMCLFLSDKDFEDKKDEIDQMLRRHLPVEFMGFPTNFTNPNPNSYLMQQMRSIKRGPVNHFIQFYTIKSFFHRFIGMDPRRNLTVRDWLAFPQQGLIEVTSGEVYYDTLGLQKVREKLTYYPDEVWEYLYAVQWERIADEQAFMGRAGEVGDELGSLLVAGHLAQNIMRLCFYIEKKYFPYVKWFGAAFSRLECAAELTGPLIDMLHGKDWMERETHLERIYEIILRLHNNLKLTKHIHIDVTDFHGRPYKTIRIDIVIREIKKVMKSEDLLQVKYPIGSLDQFISHSHINHINFVYNEFKPLLGKIEYLEGGPIRDFSRKAS